MTSTGAQAQTGLANAQTAGVVTGGGDGTVSAANNNSGSVTDQGEATGESGLSAAEGADANSAVGTQVNAHNTSQTAATSGEASATGLDAQNGVTNATQASVHVNGSNESSVTVQSSNQVIIQDTGSSAATSGDALAKGGEASLAAGAPLPPTTTGVAVTASFTSTPSAASRATAAQSMPLSATGLTAVNSVESRQTDDATLPAGTAAAGTPVSLVYEQRVQILSEGMAGAGSAPACAGAGCGGSTAPATTGLTTGTTATATTGTG
ncbi:MAG: hypothetical protein ACRDI2_09525, partial [Chloroflexota bacterium]